MGIPCRAATVHGVRCEARPGLVTLPDVLGEPADGADVAPVLPTLTAYPAGVYDLPSGDGLLAADLPAGLAAFTADAQVPWRVGALGGAVTDTAWQAKPSWYLVATEDRMIPPPAQPAPFWDYQHKRQAIARPGKSGSPDEDVLNRHRPASVRTQIRQFGRSATGHGSDQDAAHSRLRARSPRSPGDRGSRRPAWRGRHHSRSSACVAPCQSCSNSA